VRGRVHPDFDPVIADAGRVSGNRADGGWIHRSPGLKIEPGAVKRAGHPAVSHASTLEFLARVGALIGNCEHSTACATQKNRLSGDFDRHAGALGQVGNLRHPGV
jgi:hypothetical protein